jgi:hypothetical protein
VEPSNSSHQARRQPRGALGAGRRAERQRIEVGLIGRESVKARMRPMETEPPAEPVYDGGELDEAARHGHVGDVYRPHLVWPIDRKATQQIRIDPVAGLMSTPGVDGLALELIANTSAAPSSS